MKHKYGILVLPVLLALAGCGESAASFNDIKSQIDINFKKTAKVEGYVEQYSASDKSDLAKSEFTTLYYGNGMRYTASTNKDVKTDVLNCSYSIRGTASTYSYDFIKSEYRVQVGSTSFVPTFTSLTTKLVDYSTKADAHSSDADSYSCTGSSFSVSFEKIPLTVDSLTKLKLTGITLEYNGEYLTKVDYSTVLAGVTTHYCSSYTYDALVDLSTADLPDVSTWTLKE